MFGLQEIRRMNAAGTLSKAEVTRDWGVPASAVRRVANNTWRITEPNGGAERIIYHKTEVLTRLSNGIVILRTGGWDTVTTKDRINRFGDGFGLWSERGTWYVRIHKTGAKFRFVDGMTIHPDGHVTAFLMGPSMEPVPEGSPTLAARMGNLITEGIVEWQRETDAAGGKDTDPAPCRLYSIIDKLESMGLARTDSWDIMDPHVHDSTTKEV